MKTYNNPIKMVLLLVIAAWTMSSCQDWLTIYPQNQIVEDNFWEDKNDLEGVRYAAYQQMCNTLSKLVLWGDLRADSYRLCKTDQSTDGTPELYKEIREGRIERDSANSYFDWSGLYQTINYCNKVLQHGPEVLANDKQFTNAEWLQMKAEITGLRALNYFYLIRAFKDVPYSTKVVNNDTEVMYFGATNQLVVLDSLIVDVEEVAGQARNRFSQAKDTKGLITNAALYAMLSDMYLWRGALHEGRFGNNYVDTVNINNVAARDSSYRIHTFKGDHEKAVEYADKAMAALADQNERNKVGGFSRAGYEMLSYGLDNVSLYKNVFEGFSNGSTPVLYAYMQIFGGNSDESIFELQFSTSEKREHSLNTIWGNSQYSHLSVSDAALGNIYTNEPSDRARDTRLWFSAWNLLVGESQATSDWYCFKWSGGNYTLSLPQNHECASIRVSFSSSSQSNWFIYRLSDVMLQKAEALVALGQKTEAMRYVNAIHRRWYCNDDKSGTQPTENVTNTDGGVNKTKDEKNNRFWGNAPAATAPKGEAVEEYAVLNERQLEFLGEGKRWFDLVRYAERHAGGTTGNGKDPRAWDAAYGNSTRSQYFAAEACEPAGTNSGIDGVEAMVDNLMQGEFSKQLCTQLKNRFKNRYGLYNLIFYKEIQAGNGKLEQNPVWNKSMYD